MLKIKLPVKNPTVIFGLSGSFLAGMVVLVWLNQGSMMEPAQAEERIRLLLSRSVTQNYSDLFNDNNTLDFDTGMELQRELREVSNLDIVNISIKKLIPDYILRPHRPTFIIKADVGNHEESTTRYFWLSFSRVDRETSETTWHFAM